MLGRKVVAKGLPGIPPRLNSEEMPADARRHEARLPPIVHHEPHRDTMPTCLIFRAPQHRGRQHLVTIGKDIGADRDAFADHVLHGKRAIGHTRFDCLDGDPRGLKSQRVQVFVADQRVPHGSRG